MNARQMKKYLKRQIESLESDNDLMRRIIADSSKMQELYDLYNKPVNVQHTTMPFQEYRAKRMIPIHMAETDGIMEHTKQELARDLLEGVKDNITYDIDTEYVTTTITASVFVGIK